MSLRILFLANVEPIPDSGASGTEVQTISGLKALGHEVDAVWARDLHHLISHPNLYQAFELPRAYRAAMLKQLSKNRYDIIHVNQPYGYLAAKSLRQQGYPGVFVHRSHGFEGAVDEDLRKWNRVYRPDDRPVHRRLASGFLQPALRRSQRLIATHAQGHIVSATRCRDFLVGHLGVSAERIAIIPQAPPESYQKKPNESVSKNRLNRLLHVGQYAFYKGTPVLVEAVTEILRMRSQVSFTWVCAEEHHAEANRLFPADVRPRVSFRSWCSQNDLISIYDDHGVFLFPSFFEGFGKAFIEAMTRGLIVVASATGGMRDVILSGRDGILFETGNVAGMINACLRAMDNRELSEEISVAARKTAEKFSWERVARETASFYQILLRLEEDRVSPRQQ